MNDLVILAAGLDRLLDAAHWRAWPPSPEVSVPDSPVDLVDLAETLLTHTGAEVDYEAHDVTATWLSRPDAKTEAQIMWDGSCISFATALRLIPDTGARVGYYVLQPDEDVGGPQVFARATWPAVLDARLSVARELFASVGGAFAVDLGSFYGATVRVDDLRVRRGVRRGAASALRAARGRGGKVEDLGSQVDRLLSD